MKSILIQTLLQWCQQHNITDIRLYRWDTPHCVIDWSICTEKYKEHLIKNIQFMDTEEERIVFCGVVCLSNKMATAAEGKISPSITADRENPVEIVAALDLLKKWADSIEEEELMEHES